MSFCKKTSFVAYSALRAVAVHDEALNLLQIQSKHLAESEHLEDHLEEEYMGEQGPESELWEEQDYLQGQKPELNVLEEHEYLEERGLEEQGQEPDEPDWRGKTGPSPSGQPGYPCEMQTGECKPWGPVYEAWGKKDYFSYKYEKYGFPGLGCTDENGAPKNFNSLSETPTNCSFAFDKNIVGQFNKHLADFGGCVSGTTNGFRAWVAQWFSTRLKDHPKKTVPAHIRYGYREVPPEERAEACRMDAEEMDLCAGANIYEVSTLGAELKCTCGVAIQVHPTGRPVEMVCLLKSKPIADLAAPGATAYPSTKNPPKLGGWLPHLKNPGAKSTFKMSTNYTGCSKGWWHVTGEPMWSRRLYSPGGWPPKGHLMTASRGIKYPFKKLLPSNLPSDCVKMYQLTKDYRPDMPWPHNRGCKGAVALMMNGANTNSPGGPQGRCKCIFPEQFNKLGLAEVATYAYPNYGQTLHEPGNRDMWICAIDDEDPTGGDDVYPIPDWSGVVSPDGPKPKLSCTPIPSLNLANVATSNLGGQGPDLAGEKGIRFSQVGKIRDMDVDLKLVSAGPYTPFKEEQNGLSGSLGTVNVQAGTKVDVVFAVVESGTDTPVTVDGLSLTFLDVDEGKRGRQRSTVTACKAEVELDASTELTQAVDGSCTSVSSSKKGSKNDNPTSADNLTDVQKAKVVKFTYGAGAQFQASLSIAATPKSPTGRNFNFVVGILCKE